MLRLLVLLSCTCANAAMQRTVIPRSASVKMRLSNPSVERTATLPPLAALAESYSWLSKEHYLALAFTQAGVLASFADVSTQLMESGNLDLSHVAAMATVASTMSGMASDGF